LLGDSIRTTVPGRTTSGSATRPVSRSRRASASPNRATRRSSGWPTTTNPDGGAAPLFADSDIAPVLALILRVAGIHRDTQAFEPLHHLRRAVVMVDVQLLQPGHGGALQQRGRPFIAQRAPRQVEDPDLLHHWRLP